MHTDACRGMFRVASPCWATRPSGGCPHKRRGRCVPEGRQGCAHSTWRPRRSAPMPSRATCPTARTGTRRATRRGAGTGTGATPRSARSHTAPRAECASSAGGAETGGRRGAPVCIHRLLAARHRAQRGGARRHVAAAATIERLTLWTATPLSLTAVRVTTTATAIRAVRLCR